MMFLYHANIRTIKIPKISMGRCVGDFGTGIYMTPDRDLARRQAQICAIRDEQEYGVVSVFDTPHGLLDYSAIRIRKFPKINDSWLNFILRNRERPTARHSFDIVVGAAPDDSFYACLNALEAGALDRPTLSSMLKEFDLKTQYLFHTAKSLLFLEYLETEVVPCSMK